MTPQERALAARNLRELSLNTTERLQNPFSTGDQRLGEAVIVLADMLAMLFEDGLDAQVLAEAGGR